MRKTGTMLITMMAIVLLMAGFGYTKNTDKLQAAEGSDLIRWKQPLEVQRVSQSEEPPYDEQLELDAERIGRVESSVSMDMDAEEMQILEKIAVAEAGTEGIEGMALVIRVVINRVMSGYFPDSIEEVVDQKVNGVWQFSTVGDGSYTAAAVTKESGEALDLVLSGWDKSQNATYFCTKKAAGKWHAGNLQLLFTYGRHCFYKEADK